MEGAAIPSVVWGLTGVGLATDITCCAGRGECKPGVPVITAESGTATDDRDATAGLTELGRAIADGLIKIDEDDGGVENLGKWGAIVDEIVDSPEKHSACMGVPVATLTVANAEVRVGAPVITGETRAESRVGAPTNGDAGLPIWEVGNLGKADTTLVVLGNKDESRPGAPTSLAGVTLGLLASTGETTAGVHATIGELMAGTAGSPTGDDWGSTGVRGATAAGGAAAVAAVVMVALVLGTSCGAGLEMMRTWLPGPKPCGGTTKRALLKKICVPAARGVLVLMTILCWIMPVAEVVTGVVAAVTENGLAFATKLFSVAEETDIWVLM